MTENTTAIAPSDFCTQCWKRKDECMCGCTLVHRYPLLEETKYSLAIKHYLETGDIEPYRELVG
jgi:hypothetical protein